MVVEESYCSLLRQILGDTVTKGSVYVLFDEGSKSKWVRHLVTSKMTPRFLSLHGSFENFMQNACPKSMKTQPLKNL